MTGDPMVEHDQLVTDLRGALYEGQSGLNYVPRLLRRLLETEAWRERYDAKSRQSVRFDSFTEFVTTAPTEGLGTDVNLVKRIVSDDKTTADLLDQTLQGKHGGDHSKKDNIILAPGSTEGGTSRDAALRRLRKDAPELHAEVLDGDLSAHAAMVKAGFRPKTFTVRPDPDSAARTLRKHMTPDDLNKLARLLLESENE